MSNVILMKLVKCGNKIPTKFLELSNVPLTVVLPSVSNNIWEIGIKIFEDKEVSERQLLLKATVDAERVLHFDEIGTLNTVEGLINMFLIKDVFIELTFCLFEFSESESDGFFMVPTSIKSSVKVERVEKNIVDLDVEGLLINC